MPIFEVTLIETVERKCVAYIDAPNVNAADEWVLTAPDNAFKVISENKPWTEAELIVPVDVVPADWPKKAVHKCAS